MASVATPSVLRSLFTLLSLFLTTLSSLPLTSALSPATKHQIRSNPGALPEGNGPNVGLHLYSKFDTECNDDNLLPSIENMAYFMPYKLSAPIRSYGLSHNGRRMNDNEELFFFNAESGNYTRDAVDSTPLTPGVYMTRYPGDGKFSNELQGYGGSGECQYADNYYTEVTLYPFRLDQGLIDALVKEGLGG